MKTEYLVCLLVVIGIPLAPWLYVANICANAGRYDILLWSCAIPLGILLFIGASIYTVPILLVSFLAWKLIPFIGEFGLGGLIVILIVAQLFVRALGLPDGRQK